MGGHGIDGLGSSQGVGGKGGAKQAEGGFAEAFDSAIKGVDQKQAAADNQLYDLASGKNADLHSTMIALEEANIALRTMASTRDKIVEAYQAIWNMPI